MSLRIAMEELNRNVRQGVISQSVYNAMVEQIYVNQQVIEKKSLFFIISGEKIAIDERKKAERIVLLAQKRQSIMQHLEALWTAIQQQS